MRKIIILFVVSVIVLFSGCFIFAAEVSQIDSIEQIEKSTAKSATLKMNDKTKTVVIDTSIYNRADESIVGDVYITECREDSSLAPNEVILEYNDKFKTETHELGDTTEINFSTELSWLDINGNGTRNFDDYLEIWKTKKVIYQKYDADYFDVNIRYGSNVQVLDKYSEEYQNEYLDTGEQYY